MTPSLVDMSSTAPVTTENSDIGLRQHAFGATGRQVTHGMDFAIPSPRAGEPGSPAKWTRLSRREHVGHRRARPAQRPFVAVQLKVAVGSDGQRIEGESDVGRVGMQLAGVDSETSLVLERVQPAAHARADG